MNTAENIVNDYLEQGYSLEALRLLAETRPHPLGTDMLAVIDSLEDEAEPVACVTEGGNHPAPGFLDIRPVEEGELAVVDEDGVAEDGAGIDFDLMAATMPSVTETARVADEESVADIVVDVADTVPDSVDREHSGEGGHPEMPGVWSRLWSFVGRDVELAATDNVSPELQAMTVASLEFESHAAVPTLQMPENDVLCDLGLDERVGTSQFTASMDADADYGAAEAAGDYLPGAVSTQAVDSPVDITLEQQRLQQAQRVLLDAGAGSMAEPEVAEPDTGAIKPVSRKERRRKERVQKKKAKRAGKSGSATATGTASDLDVEMAGTASNLLPEGNSEAPEAVSPGVDSEMPLHELSLPAEATEDIIPTKPDVVASSDDTALFSMEELSVSRELILFRQESIKTASIGDSEAGNEETLPTSPEVMLDESFVAGDDHVMIVANGGLDLREMARIFQVEPADSIADAAFAVEEEEEANVILFQDKFPTFAGRMATFDEEEEEYQPILRVLHSDEEVTAGPENVTRQRQPEATEVATDGVNAVSAQSATTFSRGLTDNERACLLRAFTSDFIMEEILFSDEHPDHDQHILLSQTPETEPDNLLEREVAVRTEIVNEYQERLDSFAARILESQAALAEGESVIREKDATLQAQEAALRDLAARLESEEAKAREVAAKLDTSRRETGSKQAEIERFSGVLAEHERLFNEFEDLRIAYNEVVTRVMPELQNERDELALTVERQAGQENAMRISLASSKRRLAASYVLSAAACVIMVALPVANWIKSGETTRELALEHQRITELREELATVTQRNVEAKTTIADLEQKMQRSGRELADLQKKNKELARLSNGRQNGMAVFPPEAGRSDGTPTRASTMALQATPQGDRQQLRYNEIRDADGGLANRQVQNRRGGDGESRQMASVASRRGGDIPLSAVARQDPQNGLRPAAQAARAGRTETSRASTEVATAGTTTATVKKGEGVAQVVYRVLGTWDPEVVAWVIRENKIRTNQRGNPLIQPGQKLRLPKNGHAGQTASR